MAQQIIIEGDLVQLVETTVARTTTLADWLPTIERRVPVHTPVLPRATRALWYDTTNTALHKLMVLMELEPQTINLNKRGAIHRVMIPWTRFVFYCTNRNGFVSPAWRMDDYRIFWSKNRYTNPAANDAIRALVPNVYEDGRICFGSTAANASQSISDRLDQTANEFYATTFNDDLGTSYPGGYRGFRAWVAATGRDPLGWMTWDDLNYGSDRFSWNHLVSEWEENNTSREDPVILPDAIPPLAIGASFGRTEEWLLSLTPAQRARIRASIAGLPVEDAIPDPVFTDTDENEDEEDEDGEM